MTPPPRLLMTADAVGGVWTYALDLCRALSLAGCRTTLAVLGPSPSAPQRQAAEAIAGLELVDSGLPLDWLAPDRASVLEAGRAVAELAAHAGADIVHLNSPALAACGAFEGPVIGACHSCLATWWEAVRHGPPPEDFRWRIDLLAEGYGACTSLVAPSAAFARATAEAYPSARPHAVHNGRSRAPLIGWAERPPAVITAGRLWDPGKNLASLDAAAARLSAPVLAAGPLQGPHGERTCLAHIRHLGSLTPLELARRMARTPVFASLALYEPFGLGVLEAAQASCALVLSDIPTFRELWTGAAVFVDPREPAAAAEALEALLADRDRSAALGAAARARADRYTVEAMAAATLAAYAAAPPAREEAAA